MIEIGCVSDTPYFIIGKIIFVLLFPSSASEVGNLHGDSSILGRLLAEFGDA